MHSLYTSFKLRTHNKRKGAVLIRSMKTYLDKWLRALKIRGAFFPLNCPLFCVQSVTAVIACKHKWQHLEIQLAHWEPEYTPNTKLKLCLGFLKAEWNPHAYLDSKAQLSRWQKRQSFTPRLIAASASSKKQQSQEAAGRSSDQQLGHPVQSVMSYFALLVSIVKFHFKHWTTPNARSLSYY